MPWPKVYTIPVPVPLTLAPLIAITKQHDQYWKNGQDLLLQALQDLELLPTELANSEEAEHLPQL